MTYDGAPDWTTQVGRELGRLVANEASLRSVISQVRALHQPTPVSDDTPDDDQPAAPTGCRACCVTSDDVLSDDCTTHHDHTPGTPTCPTTAILDTLETR